MLQIFTYNPPRYFYDEGIGRENLLGLVPLAEDRMLQIPLHHGFH
jgi:hypothetical protein